MISESLRPRGETPISHFQSPLVGAADLSSDELQLVLRQPRSPDPSDRPGEAGRGVVAIKRAVDVSAVDAGFSLAEISSLADGGDRLGSNRLECQVV